MLEHHKLDVSCISRHADEGPGAGSTLSGCCSHSECDHLPAACQQRSDAAGRVECPPCPVQCATH